MKENSIISIVGIGKGVTIAVAVHTAMKVRMKVGRCILRGLMAVGFDGCEYFFLEMDSAK
jgi:hypothetical protein